MKSFRVRKMMQWVDLCRVKRMRLLNMILWEDLAV